MKLSFKTILPILFAGCGTTPLLTYTVTYDGNGNKDGAVPTDANFYEEGASVTVLDQGSLVRAGYTFASWNTEAGGSGTGFTETIAVTASIPVYAQWTAAPVVSVTDTWSVVDTDSLNGESANLGGGQQHIKWFAKNRINNTGFEMAIGTDDGAPAGQNTADTVWVSEQQVIYSLI